MSNKVGIYYAYWTQEWDVDLLPYVDRVAQIGFDILEINSDCFLKLPTAARHELATVAKDQGVELTFCVGLGNQYDISAEDEVVRKSGIAYLKRTIECMAEIGGNNLSGILYSAWNPGRLPTDQADKQRFWHRSVTSMKEVASLAEDLGVYCNLEVVNRFEQFILNTCEEAVCYVTAVDSPNIRLLLDTYHMNIEEDSFREAIVGAGDRLGHLHIGENNRKPPGQGGHIDWEEIFTALKEIKYNGSIVMEPFVRLGGTVGADIKVWRNLKTSEQLDKEAQEALKFVRSLLT